ncbi:uncharacterized protein LOC110862392 isoform X3 [Folsomia candida]|uniref:uncharacterized protein LOC110862392 isoform X3 n=1 Tax=Folsomia candida TaxID=158441 RepID=UPI001604ECE7|nr:uncharacterized protein LOC110862392 isoform X3 [Folsomia candida]
MISQICVVNLDYENTPAGRGWLVTIDGLDHMQVKHFQDYVTSKAWETDVIICTTLTIGPGEEPKFLGGDFLSYDAIQPKIDSYFEILDFLGFKLIGVNTTSHPEKGKRSTWTMKHKNIHVARAK